jgi:hypothetical protein
MAQAILYINGSDSTFTATEPDLTGKVVIDLEMPDGLPLSFAVNQLSALAQQFNFPGNVPVDYSLVVFRVTVGTA